MTDGILTHADIDGLIANGSVTAEAPPESGQVQPTSLDLRLGSVAFRMRAGFLPHRDTVEACLRDMPVHRLDLTDGAVLERGHIYLIPLQESLALPDDLRARCNPKSSTGRIDLFTRVITDRSERFDDVRAGYRGRLYLEVMPRSFPVRARTGVRLHQIRFLRGRPQLSDDEHREAHRAHRLVTQEGGAPAERVVVDGGFHLTVSLRPERRPDGSGVIGWRARRYTDVVDLEKVGAHDAAHWFEPIAQLPPDGAARGARLLLEPEEFYVFASRERLRVPPHLAAEMLAVDVGIGELRTNYAGFFDAGFGWGAAGDGMGTPAVLEVRPHDVPFLIGDGQILFRIEYHRTTRPCTRLYGAPGSGANYANQGLTLAKYFKQSGVGSPESGAVRPS